VARMRLGDIAQFALGLFIPPLLVLHFLASRGAPLFCQLLCRSRALRNLQGEDHGRNEQPLSAAAA
jgi:hypothetical protein